MRECRDIYQDIAKDKQFYVTKISDQRTAIRNLEKAVNDKDLQIADLKK